MRSLITYLLLVLMLGVSSCDKEEASYDRPNEYSLYLNSSLDGFRFREGSYWVYTADGVAWDSVYVQDQTEGFAVYDQDAANGGTDRYSIQYHDLNLRSDMYNYNEQAYLATNGIYPAQHNPLDPQVDPLMDGSWVLGEAHGNTHLVAAHDTMTCLAGNFNNVLVFRYTQPIDYWSDFTNWQDTFSHADYYWVDGVGIVLKEIHGTSGAVSVWELQHYQVNF